MALRHPDPSANEHQNLHAVSGETSGPSFRRTATLACMVLAVPFLIAVITIGMGR